MDAELELQIAASLETTPDLLPYLPELLADIWPLGCSPGAIVDLLRPLGLPPRTTRLLDLGCGKGAVAVTVAAELGFTVDGVDGFAPFLGAARERAADLEVVELCSFEGGDLRETVRAARGYDVVVYASHGPMLLGRPCVEVLRRCVRRGGHVVVDDGFLAVGTRSRPPGYEDYLPYAESVARLTAAGDALVGEKIFSTAERDVENRAINAAIRRRAEALAARHPEVAERIVGYVENQERECRILREIHVPAVWLLRRT